MVRLETELLDSLMNLLNKKNKKTQLTEKELNEIEKYRDENGFINLVDVDDFDEMKRIIELVDKKNELEEEAIDTPKKDCDVMKYIIDLVDNNNEIDEEDLNEFVKGLTNDLLKFTGANNARINFEAPNKSIRIEANEGEEPKFTVTTSPSVCSDKLNDSKPNICKCNGDDFVWKTSYCQCNSDDLKLQPELCECGKPKTECDKCEKCCESKHNTCETEKSNKIESRKGVFQPNEQALFEIEEDDDVPVVVVHNAGGMFNPQYYNAVMHICEIEHFKNDDIYSDNEVNVLCADKVVLLPNVWGKIFDDVAYTFSKQILDGQEVYIINPDNFEIKHITEPMELWDYAMNNIQEEIINDYGRY